jgi:hypothetical protein
MKSIITFLLLLIILLNGCSAEDHLEFNNVPINGNIDSLANELIKIGFNQTEFKNEDQIKLNGVFLEKSCAIFVFGTKQDQTAYKVVVNMPGEIHDSLEYSYDKLQKLFSAKYGNGISKYKQFRNAERFLFNEPKRVRHLSKGDHTRYNTDSGDIILEVRDGYISITYLDKVNNELNIKETEKEKISS